MQFHPDDFDRLAAEVERQGGTSLPGAHNARRIYMKAVGPDGTEKHQDAFTIGCGREARFLVPYGLPQSKLGKAMEKRGAGIVEVCAVDDDMGKWPRFQDAMKEDSY